MSKTKKILTLVLILSGIISACAGVVIFTLSNSSTSELNKIIRKFEILETSGYDLESTQYKDDVLINSDTINCTQKVSGRINEIDVTGSPRYSLLHPPSVFCLFVSSTLKNARRITAHVQ